MDTDDTQQAAPVSVPGGSAFDAGAVIQDRRGRFAPGGELTDKQRDFVNAFLANGGKRKLAAISAGYTHPDIEASRLMHNPAVVGAIKRATASAITDMSQVALATIKQIMLDTAAPPAARFAAAKWTLEAEGHGVAAQALQLRAGTDPQDKPMSEWTLADLEEMVARKEREVDALRPNKAPIVPIEASVVAD